uniref:Uncharacterized protein n=1 Tax=Pyricularia oryzae (strain P131) TaxID=1143193 RepID=L7ISF6_PYRO1
MCWKKIRFTKNPTENLSRINILYYTALNRVNRASSAQAERSA